MDNNSSYESAPLVTTSAREAAEAMISEGGPIFQPSFGQFSENGATREYGSYQERVRHQVGRHPIYSVGIAFGFGLVLGLLIEP